MNAPQTALHANAQAFVILERFHEIVDGAAILCDKYRQMTGDKGKAVPASAPACRHYVTRPK